MTNKEDTKNTVKNKFNTEHKWHFPKHFLPTLIKLTQAAKQNFYEDPFVQ